MNDNKMLALMERKAAALGCIEQMGRFLLLVEDCPRDVYEAWLKLTNYVKEYQIPKEEN